MNEHNMDNVRHEASRTSNTKKKYLKDNINQLETNSTKVSETFKKAQMNLRKVTNLVLLVTWQKIRRDFLQILTIF
jgi:hypothetical protein